MSKFILFFSLMVLSKTIAAQSENIYDYSFINIEGDSVSMGQFRGKKILIVNTASKCGFTKQYEQLQELHKQFGDNVTIIGFPCNQFGKQESGTEEKIQAFCQKNYGVEFLMASKIKVKGKEQHPIYKWLTDIELNNVLSSEVKWNFAKYIIDEKGNFITHFGSRVIPTDDQIVSLLK